MEGSWLCRHPGILASLACCPASQFSRGRVSESLSQHTLLPTRPWPADVSGHGLLIAGWRPDVSDVGFMHDVCNTQTHGITLSSVNANCLFLAFQQRQPQSNVPKEELPFDLTGQHDGSQVTHCLWDTLLLLLPLQRRSPLCCGPQTYLSLFPHLFLNSSRC